MTTVKLDGSLDGLALAELVRRKEVTAAELVEAAIARVEAHDPALNAVVDRLYDRARAQAAGPLPDGPFTGVPYLLKEILGEEAGVVSTEGSRFFRDRKPAADSELVRRHRKAGLVAIGKSNVPELGILPTTEPVLHGPAHNPWVPERTPGGSSGGAAAAVAARLVPIAHANDGGGSIRIPASCCGVFGLKPTRGRNPLGPAIGESWHGLVVEHAVTVSVRDSAALLDATAGPDAGAPYAAPPPERPYLEEVGRDPGKLRIGFTVRSQLGHEVHPDCVESVRDAASLCEKLGHRVEEAAPPVDREAFTRAFLVVVAGEISAQVARRAAELGRQPGGDELEPSTWLLVRCGQEFTAAEFVDAVKTLQQASRRMAPWFEQFDLLLMPTLGQPPVKIGALAPRPAEVAALGVLRRAPVGVALRKILAKMAEELAFEFAAFTQLANVTGQPAMSVPLFWNRDGLPIGAHFTARFGDEATLFRLAAQLEAARPWAQRRPKIG